MARNLKNNFNEQSASEELLYLYSAVSGCYGQLMELERIILGGSTNTAAILNGFRDVGQSILLLERRVLSLRRYFNDGK